MRANATDVTRQDDTRVDGPSTRDRDAPRRCAHDAVEPRVGLGPEARDLRAGAGVAWRIGA